jgi:hypothetical protein
MASMAPEKGDMRSYSTKLERHGGPDHGWWVELLRDGERIAYTSLDEWKSFGATDARGLLCPLHVDSGRRWPTVDCRIFTASR